MEISPNKFGSFHFLEKDMRLSDGLEAKKMEKEEPDALEVGKEKAQKAQEEDEEKGRRPLGQPLFLPGRQ